MGLGRMQLGKKIRKKKKTNFSINSIDLNYEKPNK